MWQGELPVPPGYDSRGLIAGERTVATQVLSPHSVFDRLYNAVHETADSHFGAFYSSELGGIVTNPALMVMHMDDHMVHQGHAVFDTAIISNGFLYQLPQHLRRFKRSAHMAGLTLPMSDAAMARVILDTAAASERMDGMVKYWVSSGRGGFDVSSMECVEPTFYVMATSEARPVDRTTGWTACTSAVAPKPAPFGTIKSTNYLQNVLAKTQAEAQGMDVGLFVDEAGHILEGPNANFAMVTKDNVFVTPPFDNVLSGVTIQRLMELIPEENHRHPNAVVIKKVEQRPIHADEVCKAKEAFLVGSTHLVVPLISLNSKPIGNGKPGPAASALANILEADKQPREDSTQHIKIPYSHMMGMKQTGV